MQRQLAVSLHDVCPDCEADFMAWRKRLDEWNIAPRSLAVIPLFEGKRLRDFPRLVDALHAEVAAGSEIVLHGFRHRFEGVHGKWIERAWSRFVTRGCEEFAGLAAGEAEERIHSGLSELALVLPEAHIEGFIAPGWWHSSGTLEAAARVGLRFVQGLNGIFDVRAGKWIPTATLCGLPMEAGFFGPPAEAWGLARIALHRSRVVCLALHPYDLRNRRFLRNLERTLRSFRNRSVRLRLLRELLSRG